MSRPAKLAAGHYVCGSPAEKFPRTATPAVVIMRTLTGDTHALTPDEARNLAEILIAEADHADPDGTREP